VSSSWAKEVSAWLAAKVVMVMRVASAGRRKRTLTPGRFSAAAQASSAQASSAQASSARLRCVRAFDDVARQWRAREHGPGAAVKLVHPLTHQNIPTMDFGITGRTAVITGAAGDMARETATFLLDEGVDLVLTDIDEDELKQAAEKLGGEGERITTVVADLSDQSGADKLRDAAPATVDILVHAAGVTGAKGDPLKDISEEDWEHAWQTDFMSAVRVAKTFVPKMAERGWGRVVYVTSENVAQPYPDEMVYNAAKASLLSFVKGTAQVYAPKGVRINAVAPAFIETDMTDGMMEKRADEMGVSKEEAIESFLDEERPYLVLGRRGKPKEVAAVIAFLCSEHASFVVGSNYRVDGGAVMSLDL
jgi:NAD(P)-dependent dehydrogenase (short-subunit alcohol dehydrogenase family)